MLASLYFSSGGLIFMEFLGAIAKPSSRIQISPVILFPQFCRSSWLHESLSNKSFVVEDYEVDRFSDAENRGTTFANMKMLQPILRKLWIRFCSNHARNECTEGRLSVRRYYAQHIGTITAGLWSLLTWRQIFNPIKQRLTGRAITISEGATR